MLAQERAFRNYIKADNLIKFEVIEKETDLLIQADSNLFEKALSSVLKYRAEIEKYIELNPQFLKSYSPLSLRSSAGPILKAMAAAAKKTRVGPMAAVAGAIAEYVGKDLLPFTNELIIENGGDLFLKINQSRKFDIYSSHSPFSEKIALEIDPQPKPFSICTTSGTSGSSFSFGKADLVIVIAESAPLADATATAIGNIIKDVSDLEQGINLAKKIKGLYGVLIIKDDQLGVVGKIKIVPL